MLLFGFSEREVRFSALQRAEIAENEARIDAVQNAERFSALQRAEIAEKQQREGTGIARSVFQCSSTSRNC